MTMKMLLIHQFCLPTMRNEQNRKQTKRFKPKLILKSNEVRVEFTFSADDNEDAPDSPISLPIKCETNSNG